MMPRLTETGTNAFGNPIFATTTTQIGTNSEKTVHTYSAYVQDEWKALDTVTVNPGIRFDEVNGFTEGGHFSPRLNTVWQATPSTTVHAGYAKYFKFDALCLHIDQIASISLWMAPEYTGWVFL